ncbi:uncharacterized protein LOC114324595 [Diabrotica virgifera virgifera]|uniref:Uncharacterized protein n=1 Tax=Diabrotica virgifera virgifera TaxID=50390 RepID=A0ABM5I9Y8_DIAVI|nr:uncharacterized protein LOC114324595 [Diabrotica virgifera virgifera]
MRKLVLVLFFVICAYAQDNFENTGVRLALKIYDDCTKADGLSPCLKRKAITFLDRLSRMDKFALTDGVTVQKASDAVAEGPALTEEQLDNTLPRSSDAKDAALTNMLFEKVGSFIGSRSLEVTLPKIQASDFIEEGRKKGGKGGMKGMMGGMIMGIAAKMAALVPLAIAGLFLLAGKALITAKIALLLSGIIAIKKLFAQKQGGGGGGGWQSSGGHGGGGGGWQSSGGGWDKRSYDASNLAYSAYSPQ